MSPPSMRTDVLLLCLLAGAEAARLQALSIHAASQQKIVHGVVVDKSKGADFVGEYRASCSDLQKDFERHSHKTQNAMRKRGLDGRNPTSGVIYGALKMRKVAKAYVRAQQMNCAWVEDKQHVDVRALVGIVKLTEAFSPCFGKAEEMMHNASRTGQVKTVIEAIGSLLSRCGVPLLDMPQAESPNAIDTYVNHLGDMVSEMDDAADNVEDKLADVHVGDATQTSLLEVARGTFGQTQLTDASLHQYGTKTAIVAALVLSIATLLAFVLGCGMVVALVMQYLTLILCMLNYLFIWVFRGTLMGCLQTLLYGWRQKENPLARYRLMTCRADLFMLAPTPTNASSLATDDEASKAL